jgi:hypothetical protein
MKIRVGFEMLYDFPQPTPMIMVLGTHFTRVRHHRARPPDDQPLRPNHALPRFVRQLVQPDCCAGRSNALGRQWRRSRQRPTRSGLCFSSTARVEDLPADTLVYLLGSRYCETDRLSEIAWKLFANTIPGWARVQAICDFCLSPHRIRLRARPQP